MRTIIKKTVGKNYLLNYSGIEITGTLTFYNSERHTFICRIIDPFTKVERLQSFIQMDFISAI